MGAHCLDALGALKLCFNGMKFKKWTIHNFWMGKYDYRYDWLSLTIKTIYLTIVLEQVKELGSF